jgi:hypothetical protein
MSSTNSGLSATLPFYSPEIRTSLLQLIEANASTASAAPSFNAVSTPAAVGTVVRGKYVHSDSLDEETSGKQSDDDSSSSSSEMERVPEEESDAPTEQPTKKPAAAVKAPRNPKNKSKKRTKEDILSKLHAPSIMLPLPPDNLHNNMALNVPTILLPNNYLRDNPNWNVHSAATHLLSTWESLNTNNSTIILVLLQSGRFASAVYSLHNATFTMLSHKTSTRYTIRKGQGGSQSSHDQSRSKAKSVGSQLRREGERQLRLDAISTWKEWRKCGYVQRASAVYISVPKSMRRDYLFGGEDGNKEEALVAKGDERVRTIPLDCGRPTLEAVQAAVECLWRCERREMSEEELRGAGGREEEGHGSDRVKCELEQQSHDTISSAKDEEVPVAPPYTPLHEAVVDGNLSRLMELLQLLEQSETQQAEEQSYDINTQGGADYQTPLHLASSSTHDNAPAILNALLTQGHANPCAIDSRGRPPYFLASSDKLRETFRLARHELGEGYCSWDDAKVGPPLTVADIDAKKAKALEKKKRQRARQKEKKAEEKAAEAEEAAQLQREADAKRQEEEAKRIRDGLKPKSSTSNSCDYCQKICKGKKRSQMFQRLEYAYCSTECVKKHQRELVAAAATARMGG